MSCAYHWHSQDILDVSGDAVNTATNSDSVSYTLVVLYVF